MSAKTAICIGGRFGDIINILPVARDIALKEGGRCAMVVSAEFASVLEGCSYVEPVVVSSHFTDIQPAIEQAQRMFERVLVAKVNEKAVGVTTQCEAFNQEAWRQCGYHNDWFRLPLVFDRRDREREAALIKQVSNGRPMVLVNFSGKSAPFKYGDDATKWIGAYHLVDLANIKAHRIYDLIGLMDVAEMLITGDTSTLHLSAASGVPTVNLIGDHPTKWHGSKPRNNDVLSVRYADCPAHLQLIRGASTAWKPRTWHVWSNYEMTGDTLRRHKLAALTWRDTGWIDFPMSDTPRVINDFMRSVPFVKDLVNAAVRAAGPRDTIILTNSDTCVADDAAKRISEVIGSVSASGCCYSYRRDFPVLNKPITRAEIRTGRYYPGCDLFAFNVAWWEKHSHRLPDLVIGAEGWDWCLRLLMKATGGAEFDDLIFHEQHANSWESEQNRHTLPSQRHNLSLTAPFIAAHQ